MPHWRCSPSTGRPQRSGAATPRRDPSPRTRGVRGTSRYHRPELRAVCLPEQAAGGRDAMSGFEQQIERLVARIHASPTMAVVVVAGAGGQALAWLLGVPGASKTVLEATVPYSRASMAEYLGQEPAEYVSAETAIAMAQAAYGRALRLRESDAPDTPVVGLACTASIATERSKRGEHRCCVATWDGAAGATTYSLELEKGRRDRAAEDEVVSRLILHALAESCGVPPDLPLGLHDGERLDVTR